MLLTECRRLNSCIYVGTVRHRRKKTAAHQFKFQLYMLLLDLDELETVFRGRLLWSTSRTSIVRFRSSDHLKKYAAEPSLKERVYQALAELGETRPIGPVRLLTQVRHFGFYMNPVSFYYCFDPTDCRVLAVLAEVNNTPWGQQHLYLVSSDQKDQQRRRVSSDRVDKTFHVSPFMEMDMHYRMIFTWPEDRLGVKMENWQSGNRIFDVSMLLEKRNIDGFTLAWMLVRHPLMSLQTFAGIYFQALRLWIKKVPFIPHPDKQSLVN